ncbi:hypothetical protein [Ancylothrix sp. D3o]|uniref:hypothetical protein n=1 Tax=Ancylothrix sp. D3o TaxID=2953691 RepID=UPI0021BB4F80|nr:hypothetical protein [Ancylothrix sp. D3o]
MESVQCLFDREGNSSIEPKLATAVSPHKTFDWHLRHTGTKRLMSQGNHATIAISQRAKFNIT